jgi:hypothetical protein
VVQPVGNFQDPDDPDAGTIVDPKVIAERRARRAELNEGALRERAVKVEAQLGEAQRQLDGAQEQRRELAARLKQAERDLRAARQGEHAETQRREEIEEDAAVARREAEQQLAALRAALVASEHRVGELEDELARVHRAASEVQQASRAALARPPSAGDEEHRRALADIETELATRLEEVRLVEDRLATGRRELAAHRGGLERRLHDTEIVAGGLEDALVAEREGRVRAVRALEDERERAAAEVTLLQHELDRRVRVQEEVSRQLVELRAQVQSTQARVSSDSQRAAVAESVLDDLSSTALQLHDELRGLEDERTEIEGRLAAAEAQVAERDAQLVHSATRAAGAQAALTQLRRELDEAAAALRSATADAAQKQVRLDAAEQAVTAAEEHAHQLAGQLQDERHERAQVEAQLHLTIAEERDAFQAIVEQHRVTIQAVIARERAAFGSQMAVIREGVVALRERLLQAEADVDARVQAERDAAAAQVQAERERCAAEQDVLRVRLDQRAMAAERARDLLAGELESARHDLTVTQAEVDRAVDRARAAVQEAQAAAEAAVATAQAHLAAELGSAHERAEAAEADRERLEAELRSRDAVDGDIKHSLAALRAELAEVRRESEGRAAREAQLEALVNELVGTAGSLKEGFERELAVIAGERDLQLAAERERFSSQLAEMEQRVAEMREQLSVAATELSRQLEAERTARWAAEEQLSHERELAAGGGVNAADAADLAEVGRLQALLAQQEEAGVRAEDRIVELEDELEQARIALRPPPPMPPADHPALKDVAPADPSEAGGADSVIIDLARAAARLRARREEAAAGAAAEAGGGPGGEPAGRRAGLAEDDNATAVGATDAGHGGDDAATGTDADEHRDDAGQKPAPAQAAVPEVELGRRGQATGRRVPRAWLAPAIAALARTDPRAAAAVIEALVPLQAARLRQDATYDLLIAGHPELRVQLHRDGTAVVSPRAADDAADVADFRLSGSPIALAPLVGGGTVRRAPAGVVIAGRRRRARRLTKALRQPVGLAALAEAEVPLAPARLLTLLAAAIDLAATKGERFTIAFAEDDGPVGVHLIVSDGRPIVVRAGVPTHTAATVRTAQGALAAFLAGEAPARVSGDVEVVGRLLDWADAAQGLDG